MSGVAAKSDSSLIEIVNIFLPVLVMAASFAGYTLVQKQQLTAATVFTSMVVFELLKGQMMMVSRNLSRI